MKPNHMALTQDPSVEQSAGLLEKQHSITATRILASASRRNRICQLFNPANSRRARFRLTLHQIHPDFGPAEAECVGLRQTADFAIAADSIKNNSGRFQNGVLRKAFETRQRTPRRLLRAMKSWCSLQHPAKIHAGAQ